ncbi:nucleoside phosphorylase-I family protein [Helicobacter salomonis]|uniref:purine-nucleoside phosphorylase n=1 Tax=Helicobacter salomonis TaxID=56878 RepID=UPI000CF1A791|nr:purine-nucleoside phosphorylase [Helicobacter salomonis]
MLVCAGKSESLLGVRSIGVGLVQSAISLTRLCLLERPAELIFIGSAGAYSKETPLLSFFKSQEAYQIEQSFAQGRSYTPLDNCLEVQSALFESIILPSAKVNSSNYIHTDCAFAQQMQNAGILLENMEFFSVLSVGQAFQIPSMGVFCVSNYVGPHAHQEFADHHAQVKTQLNAWSQTFVENNLK